MTALRGGLGSLRWWVALALLLAACAPAGVAAPAGTKAARGHVVASAATTGPGLAVPDLPLDRALQEPVTPTFVVEHRTALHGKTVRVRGEVIRAVLGEAACPGTSRSPQGPAPSTCGRPFVELADDAASLGTLITVHVAEDDPGYRRGDLLELSGVVEAGPHAVYLREVRSSGL